MALAKRRKPAPERTAAAYMDAYDAERRREYPAIDRMEQDWGYAVDRHKLDEAASVLACPVKANPPCWQHGRVLYTMLRRYLAEHDGEMVDILDIGTAKGFSALAMTWAARDAGMATFMASLDVLPVDEPVLRNSVWEVDGPIRLRDFHEPWPELAAVNFLQADSVAYLRARDERVHFAFVDGRHSLEAVTAELAELVRLQWPGDVVVLDDLQIPAVRRAALAAPGYAVTPLIAAPERIYGLGVRIWG